MSNVFSGVCTVSKDAEVRYLPSGVAVLNLNCANNVGFGDKQQTVWLNVTLWGKRAEGSLKDYLKKGQQIFVSGELTQREYKANDGTNRTVLEINANILDLVGKKNEAGSQPQQNHQPAGGREQQAPAKQGGGYDSFDAPYDDDIPF